MNENEIYKNLSQAQIQLDKLQVELHEESPYPTPSTKETRERILKAMDSLEKISKILDGYNKESIADRLTVEILKYFFGRRFLECEVLEEDSEMDNAWEFFNELIYESL